MACTLCCCFPPVPSPHVSHVHLPAMYATDTLLTWLEGMSKRCCCVSARVDSFLPGGSGDKLVAQAVHWLLLLQSCCGV